MVDIVVGAQWGDEGKGKVVDQLLSEQASDLSWVIRANGGPNAGHTVEVDGETTKVHQVPPGIGHAHTRMVIAPGSVIDPVKLVEELRLLSVKEPDIWLRLWISDRAHVILPHHIRQDELEEDDREEPIGTTRTGNGPAHADKYARQGMRMREALQAPPDDLAEVLEQLRPLVTDTHRLLWEARDDHILLMAAHGTLLDIDHGTYPFVTSSHCTAMGVLASAGLPHSLVRRVVGVAKAYVTRVAPGPMRTEMAEYIATIVRERGQEYGTTTGRARRIGWFDVGQLRYAASINGFTELVLSKIDVLASLEEVRVAHGEYDERVSPSWRMLPGWGEIAPSTAYISHLPDEAQDFLNYVSDYVKLPITAVGIGPGRGQLVEPISRL